MCLAQYLDWPNPRKDPFWQYLIFSGVKQYFRPHNHKLLTNIKAKQFYHKGVLKILT